jgi:hypothetical protein
MIQNSLTKPSFGRSLSLCGRNSESSFISWSRDLSVGQVSEQARDAFVWDILHEIDRVLTKLGAIN